MGANRLRPAKIQYRKTARQGPGLLFGGALSCNASILRGGRGRVGVERRVIDHAIYDWFDLIRYLFRHYDAKVQLDDFRAR